MKDKVEDKERRVTSKSMETMAIVGCEEYANRRLSEIIKYAYQNSSNMRKKFDLAGVSPDEIRKTEDLRRLPVTKKAEVLSIPRWKNPFRGFLVSSINKLSRIYISSGTIYDPEGRIEDYWGLKKILLSIGFRPGDVVMNTVTYHLTPGGIMLDQAVVDIGCIVIPMGPGNLDLQVTALIELQVNCYMGTPNFLLSILRRAEEQGYIYQRDFIIQKALVAGEILTPALRSILEKEYRIDVRQVYLTAEFGGIGYECSEKNGMHLSEDLIVEIVDPETGLSKKPGEIGEIVITSLKNICYPLIRFGTGDLSEIIDEPCPCGMLTKRINYIMGRSDGVVRAKGILIYPGQLEKIASEIVGISRFRLVVERPDQFDQLRFEIVLSEESSAHDKNKLQRKIEESAQNILKVKVDVSFVDEDLIPRDSPKIIDRRKWD